MAESQQLEPSRLARTAFEGIVRKHELEETIHKLLEAVRYELAEEIKRIAEEKQSFDRMKRHIATLQHKRGTSKQRIEWLRQAITDLEADKAMRKSDMATFQDRMALRKQEIEEAKAALEVVNQLAAAGMDLIKGLAPIDNADLVDLMGKDATPEMKNLARQIRDAETAQAEIRREVTARPDWKALVDRWEREKDE